MWMTGAAPDVKRRCRAGRRQALAKFAPRAELMPVVEPIPSSRNWTRHPGFRLTPLVIGFADVPHVRDRAAASQLPQLAVLSVMAHPELEIAEIAIEAISHLPEDRIRLYLDVIHRRRSGLDPFVAVRRSQSG
jgi:hypothetical protein